MKDNNFVLFPHFTRSDAIKQYSSPTDILANTHKNNSSNMTLKGGENGWTSLSVIKLKLV